jgi:tetratricopeptide (TPR) repeat protein
MGDKFMKTGSYEAAITEYKRFLFFNPKSEYKGYANFKMGLAYRHLYKWQESIDALKTSISESPESAEERRIILGTTLIANGNYNLAKIELIKAYKNSVSPSIHRKSLYFQGIASVYMSHWDASAEAFNRFYAEYNEKLANNRVEEINSILTNTRNSYKSVRTARLLSTIVPGLGQIYADNWRDALNAMALNGLTMGLLANAIYRKSYRDSIIMFFIAMRYYTGNRYKAEVDVREYNKSLDRETAERIIDLVRLDEPK